MSYGSWSSIFSKTVWSASENNTTIYSLIVRYQYRQDSENLKTEVKTIDITLKQHISGWGMSGYTFYSAVGFNGNYTSGSKSISGNPPNTFVISSNKTQTVSHNEKTGAASVKIYWYGYTNSSDIYRPKQSSFTYFTVTLPTLNVFPKITSVTNFTDEGSPVINYKNSLGASIISLEACIWINNTYICNYRNISKTATSYTFNLTNSEKQILYKLIPNSKTLTVRYYIRYQIESNSKKEIYKEATATIVNAAPVIETMSYVDSNNIYKSSDGYWIFNKISNLKISVSNVTYSKSNSSNPVTLKSCNCTFNGVTKTITDLTNPFDFGTINIDSNKNLAATISLTDSRGFVSTKTISVICKAYTLPAIKESAIKRINGYYETATIKISANYTNITDVTSLTIKYRYKLNTATSWSNYISINNNTETSINFSFGKDNIYNFEVVVSDGIKSVTGNYTLNKGVFPLFIDTSKTSIGINCFPTSKTLEVDGDIAVTGDYYLNDGTTVKTALATKLDKNAIITAYQGNITGTNVPSTTYINITSITLEAGIWAMSGTLKFAADTKGYRAGCINSSSKIWTDESGFQIAPSPTGSTYAQTTKIVTPTETTTYYLIAYHTSTSSIKTSGYLRAVRLKDSADSSSSTSGSGGGDSTSGVATTNYELLNNKPSIESVELSGNKTFDDFGLQEELNTNIDIEFYKYFSKTE